MMALSPLKKPGGMGLDEEDRSASYILLNVNLLTWHFQQQVVHDIDMAAHCDLPVC